MMERDMNFRSMAAGFLFATLTTLGASGQSDHAAFHGLLAYAVQYASASAAVPSRVKFDSSNWGASWHDNH
jgi:hypothetical protein